MSAINDGCLAFPSGGIPGATDSRSVQRDGMTLRDWFAGQALAGLSSAVTRSDAVKWAWEMADAMIAARQKGPK